MNFILINGPVETLTFFSNKIGEELINQGHDIFIFKMDSPIYSLSGMVDYCNQSSSVPILITFNHMGLSGEDYLTDKQGILFFDEFEIKCIDIIVDHPLYYHKVMNLCPKKYIEIFIDPEHERYSRRFYPHIKHRYTMPLPGTSYIEHSLHPKKIQNRLIDIVFTGNYTPPTKLEHHLTGLDNDYKSFYYSIIDELLASPDTNLSTALESSIKKELGNVSDNDLASAMAGMIFIDLYIRFHFRGLAVSTIADSGIPVHLFGNGWDLLKCKNPQNLIIHGSTSSSGCHEAIADSKISLNVMPWFKEGCHDRVFNSISNGSVCLTDHSKYLDIYFKDRYNITFFDLKKIDELPSIVESLLNSPEELQKIADNAVSKANSLMTWNIFVAKILVLCKNF